MTDGYPESPGRHRASPTLDAARARTDPGRSPGPRFPRQRRQMSAQRRQDITDQLASGAYCGLCGGIHAGMDMPACPRVASCETDADGKMRSVVFRADGDWDASGVYFTSDVEEDDEPPAAR